MGKLRLEGVSGDDVVELLSLGLYRWIDRWRWHRGFDCCEVPSWIEAVERVSGAFVWVARVFWAYGPMFVWSRIALVGWAL
ncbi:LOW QUALITY PROTEIN: hypothetical protein HID58_051371 [Brassica napus]|uniref:Transmembrane protein n=1 Tax=Brassica napus TaxID=3708 RepID=A0ABQ8A8R5_BRANA|nr:LOW QUALITY PROTEIN: hypothetical protein HID58_051371 [Brassica napus]